MVNGTWKPLIKEQLGATNWSLKLALLDQKFLKFNLEIAGGGLDTEGLHM